MLKTLEKIQAYAGKFDEFHLEVDVGGGVFHEGGPFDQVLHQIFDVFVMSEN